MDTVGNAKHDLKEVGRGDAEVGSSGGLLWTR
jgi:hypothetical protein